MVRILLLSRSLVKMSSDSFDQISNMSSNCKIYLSLKEVIVKTTPLCVRIINPNLRKGLSLKMHLPDWTNFIFLKFFTFLGGRLTCPGPKMKMTLKNSNHNSWPFFMVYFLRVSYEVKPKYQKMKHSRNALMHI